MPILPRAVRQAIRKTYRLPPLPSTSDILKTYRVKAIKKLSQNFLMDPLWCRRIVLAAGDIMHGYVCEVGPGPGNITRYILENGARKVVVIEKDRRFLPTLSYLSELSGKKVRIIHGDILRYDMKDTFPEKLKVPWNDHPPNIHILGNLPFSVSTPLIIKWLQQISTRSGAFSLGRVKMTLCFQQEVAERITAPELDVQRCRLSVMCQNWCRVKYKFTIRGKQFVPQPEVNAGVVHFTPRVEPLIPHSFKLVEKVMAHLFHYRQKPYVYGVRDLFPKEMQNALTSRVILVTGLETHRLALSFDMSELRALCDVYSDICDEHPAVRSYYFRATIDPYSEPVQPVDITAEERLMDTTGGDVTPQPDISDCEVMSQQYSTDSEVTSQLGRPTSDSDSNFDDITDSTQRH